MRYPLYEIMAPPTQTDTNPYKRLIYASIFALFFAVLGRVYQCNDSQPSYGDDKWTECTCPALSIWYPALFRYCWGHCHFEWGKCQSRLIADQSNTFSFMDCMTDGKCVLRTLRYQSVQNENIIFSKSIVRN